MHSNGYTIGFALVVCVTCSVVLALTAGGLRPAIERNIAFDIQRNILKAVDLYNPRTPQPPAVISSLYTTHIRGFVVDGTGRIVPGKTPDDISAESNSDLLPVFARIDNQTITGYCIPISGMGLWSTLYGYLALRADGETVMGITFYKHGETPGLGGEIEADWFTANFVGKNIFSSDGELVSIRVAKGAVPKDAPADTRAHTVDGISGATMTGNGLTAFLKSDLERYLPFFTAVRNGQPPVIQGV
ncbi:NADH:ubiquinone reductase (Na(+)-transporting) subunit C [bacterium]|nr:NADH:ubiquinone reductase (Na(+)-transporting) subunit C [candidate division CSSED10-310 bacterium]